MALAFSDLGGTRVGNAVDEVAALRHGRGHLLLAEHPSGARVVWYPQACTLKVEGRLAAIATADRRTTRLGTCAELGALPDLASRLVADLVAVDATELRRERHHLSRLDTTGELRFDDPTEGLAMLRATTGLVPGGYKGQPIYRADGQVETMYVITARRGRKVARFYDSSLHHRTGRPGELIRYEVQNRWPKASDRTPAEMCRPGLLRATYARHLEPFRDHAREITVTTATKAPAQLAQLLARGELTPRQANGLAGFVAMLPHGARQLYSEQSCRRYLRELRRRGVVLTGTEQDAALTIGQALDELLRGAELSEVE